MFSKNSGAGEKQSADRHRLLFAAANRKSADSRIGQKPSFDYQNGRLEKWFLRLEGAWEGWAEIALFRKTNREVVLAVEEVGCGPECSGAVQFLTYKNGKWTDVTDELMPNLSDEDILAAYLRVKTKDDEMHSLDDVPNVYWVLPQKGTTIKMVLGDESASNGKTLMSFNWNGSKFVKIGK